MACQSRGKLGCAIYLSTSLDLAVKHATKYTPGGECCVLACKALTGQYTVGKPGLLQPPMKNEKTRPI